MRWDRGRAVVEQLLVESRLQRVPASRAQADFLIGQARQHLTAATAIAEIDPPGAFHLTYDATRKALVAVLENQGLRPTHIGGHLVVVDAIKAQLVPPMGSTVAPFNRMRRTRNESEYPSLDQPTIVAEDVSETLPKAAALVEMAEALLDRVDPF